MFGWFKNLFSSPPRWRLVPDQHGTYTLEKWHCDVGMYLTESVRIRDRQEADEKIANMERRLIYKADKGNAS